MPYLDAVSFPFVMYGAYQSGFTIPIVTDVMRSMRSMRRLLGIRNARSPSGPPRNIPTASPVVATDVGIVVERPSV